jgi:transketolase
MEGLSHEAASLAGHLKLGKLIYLYDDNHITIEGSTDLACSDDVRGRFAAYGWHVQAVDGDDLEQLTAALDAARAEGERPSLIMARTHIGHGSPHRQDTAKAHGEPLGEEELRLTKEALGWPLEPAFRVPDEVRAHFARAIERGESLEREWRARLAAHAQAHPAEQAEWERWMARGLPAGWDRDLAGLVAESEKQPQATRAVSGTTLNVLAPGLGNLIGGSADLGPSNNTAIRDAGAFVPGRVEGPNLHFGVREHAMGGIANGMALHGGVRPFCGTFLVFSDYMRPSIRIAALSHAPVIYVFTHDSIGVGEDGPTHQPVEHLAALRAIPGLTVIRPADARETIEAWQVALQRGGPVALILTRQKLPILSRARVRLPAAGTADAASMVARGGYVLSEAAQGAAPELILIGTGSEVSRCIEAQAKLEADGIAVRVVSLPSWELFEEQPAAYRELVLPARVARRLAVEAGVPLGWERYAPATIGMTRFGASAPEAVLFEKFGLTADAIATRARALLGRGVPRSAGA